MAVGAISLPDILIMLYELNYFNFVSVLPAFHVPDFFNLTTGGDNVRKYWPRYYEGAEGVVRMTFLYVLNFFYRGKCLRRCLGRHTRHDDLKSNHY